MAKMGRPSIWAEHRDEMVRLYDEEKWSRGQIARHFGTSPVTVTRQLTAAGVRFESRVGDNPNASRTPEQRREIAAKISASRAGKGTGPRVERETRTCEECGKSYTYVPGRTGERYCSRPCSVAATTRNNTRKVRAAYDADPKRCPCGNPVPYEHRNTRQYCSAECRKTYAAKRQRDPSKWATRVCQNCGSTFELRTSSPSYGKYCSNACAYRHTKTKQHIVVDDAVVLDSGWEALFYGLCAFLKIPCERVNRETHTVVWAPDRAYAPDFLVAVDGLQVGIEVKGQEDEHDPAKWDVWREKYGPLVVIDHAALDDLRSCSPLEARNALYRWGCPKT